MVDWVELKVSESSLLLTCVALGVSAEGSQARGVLLNPLFYFVGECLPRRIDLTNLRSARGPGSIARLHRLLSQHTSD